MAPVRRLVVDVLKPHEPAVVEFARELGDVEGVDGVTASLVELDTEVENLKLTFAGEDLEVTPVQEAIQDLGGTIHSVDLVSCGDRVVGDAETHQD